MEDNKSEDLVQNQKKAVIDMFQTYLKTEFIHLSFIADIARYAEHENNKELTEKCNEECEEELNEILEVQIRYFKRLMEKCNNEEFNFIKGMVWKD